VIGCDLPLILFAGKCCMHDDVVLPMPMLLMLQVACIPLAKCAAMLTCNFPRGKSVSPPAA